MDESPGDSQHDSTVASPSGSRRVVRRSAALGSDFVDPSTIKLTGGRGVKRPRTSHTLESTDISLVGAPVSSVFPMLPMITLPPDNTRSVSPQEVDDLLNDKDRRNRHLTLLKAIRAQGRDRIWTVNDDLLLKNLAERGISIDAVAHLSSYWVDGSSSILGHGGFSRTFSSSDVAARWVALLFDPIVTETSATAYRRGLRESVPWTDAEGSLILKLSASSDFRGWQSGLQDFPYHFHPSRTVMDLEMRYRELEKSMYPEHPVKPSSNRTPEVVKASPNKEPIKRRRRRTFSRSEDTNVVTEVKDNKNIGATASHITPDTLDDHLPEAETLRQVPVSGNDSNVRGFLLSGRQICFDASNMSSVVVGRMVPGHSVDIDASLESVCSKVSRKHIVFHYKDSASTKGWQLENVGKRGITIDGKKVQPEKKVLLPNDRSSLLNLCGVLFRFQPKNM